MKLPLKLAAIRAGFVISVSLFMASVAWGQDLSPRAYVITPIHWNALTFTYTYNSGSLEFDGAVPITGATATSSTPSVSYYHSLNFFGRSANILAALPYAVGDFQGHVMGAEGHLYRSGLLDSAYRFSVNLKGGPALTPQEFPKWKQKVLIGVSLKVLAPTGQYDPTKLINWGNNRWGFKPELGYSERWGHWVVDVYGGVWFYTINQEFFSYNKYFPGRQSQSENPVGVIESHLSYDVKPRLWFSLDGNFWYGGETSLNGIPNPHTTQQSSRVGVTAAIPITKHQGLKFSYSNGAYINYGGNYQTVSAAWQYSWMGHPK